MADGLGASPNLSAPSVAPSAPDAPFGRAGAAVYAAGSFGTGVFSTVPTIILLYYCTEILHLPAAWATVIVFLPKVWSILWDPLVGVWSDRTTTPIGRRRPFMIAGTAGMTLAFVAMFSAPFLGPVGTALWIGTTYFLLATLYSLFAVPYVALPAELVSEAQSRSRLISWRMFVVMLGILTGAGLVPWLVALLGGGRTGYAAMSLWVAAACAIAMTAPIVGLRGRDLPRAASGVPPAGLPFAMMRRWAGDAAFARLAGAYLLMLSGCGAVSSAAPYLVIRFFERDERSIGTALFIMLVATTLTVTTWARVGRRCGEARTLRFASVGYAVVAALVCLLAYLHAPWPLALVAFGLLGIPFGAMQVLPYTLIATLIREGGAHDEAAEGALTGLWTATEKLGLALGPTITGLCVWATGPDAAALPVIAMITTATLIFLAATMLGSKPRAPGYRTAGDPGT